MGTPGRPRAPLPIAKCTRVLRPLVSKLHALTDLYAKYPAKFAFDGALFREAAADGRTSAFASPASAHDRLRALKPYLGAEVFAAYVEMFHIFRGVALAVGHTDAAGGNVLGRQPSGRSTPEAAAPRRAARLTSLAAHALGKSVVLGTKSTYYMLNQTLLFDQASIPPHLQVYRDQLADGVEDWLAMEPAHVLTAYRADVLWGYVLHMVVFNSHTLLFPLLPVLVHWLHEQRSPSSAALFVDFWLFSPSDPDRADIRGLMGDASTSAATLETFWLWAHAGYWRSLVRLLRVASPAISPANYPPYDSLMLDALACTDKLRLDLVPAENVYELLAKNAQYPRNTAILINVVAQSIEKLRREYRRQKTSATAYAVLHAVYHQLRLLVRTWLCLSDACVFNSLDKGNEELFDGVSVLLQFLDHKCRDVLHYLKRHSASRAEEMHQRFKYLRYNVKQTALSLVILRGFFLDTAVPSDFDLDDPAAGAEHFCELVADNAQPAMVHTFMSWLQASTFRNHEPFGDYLWANMK